MLSTDEYKDLEVSGEVVAGTNMLKILAEGTNPTVVREFADQIGVETVKFVSNLYDIFELEPLDAATTPQSPIKPNLILNLIMGVVIGAAMGTGIAFISYYMRTPHKVARHFDIVEPATGTYNVPYFSFRLRQEISRARRTGNPFSVALIQISGARPLDSNRILRPAAIYLQAELRDEDLLAYAGDLIFALLLIDMHGEVAKDHVERICSQLPREILLHSDNTNPWELSCSAGVSSFDDAMSDADDLWNQTYLALTNSGGLGNSRVNLYSQLEGIFAPAQPITRNP
jgi:GGDEF domain-containing protein